MWRRQQAESRVDVGFTEVGGGWPILPRQLQSWFTTDPWYEGTIAWPWSQQNHIASAVESTYLIWWTLVFNNSMKNTAKNTFHIVLLTVALLTCQAFSVPHISSINPQTPKCLQNIISGGQWKKRIEGKANNRWIALSLKWESPPSFPPSTSSCSLPPSTVVPVLWGKGLNGSAGLNHVLRHDPQLNATERSDMFPQRIPPHGCLCSMPLQTFFNKEFGSVGTKNVLSSSTKNLKTGTYEVIAPPAPTFSPLSWPVSAYIIKWTTQTLQTLPLPASRCISR